jgi:hypothetical protein
MSELTFPIPTELNGEQLCKELKAELVYIHGDLLYIVGDLTEAQAKQGLANHKAIMPPDIEAAKEAAKAKLAALGLTGDDLKALGL